MASMFGNVGSFKAVNSKFNNAALDQFNTNGPPPRKLGIYCAIDG
jgi:hypothetical protein